MKGNSAESSLDWGESVGFHERPSLKKLFCGMSKACFRYKRIMQREIVPCIPVGLICHCGFTAGMDATV